MPISLGEWVSIAIQGGATLVAGAATVAAFLAAKASSDSAAANKAAVEEMRSDRLEERRAREIEDLRRIHEIITEMKTGDYGNPALRVYPLKRELSHLLAVCGIVLTTCTRIAKENDLELFRPLIPAALEEVKEMIDSMRSPENS